MIPTDIVGVHPLCVCDYGTALILGIVIGIGLATTVYVVKTMINDLRYKKDSDEDG